jgi:hypothetical protein
VTIEHGAQPVKRKGDYWGRRAIAAGGLATGHRFFGGCRVTASLEFHPKIIAQVRGPGCVLPARWRWSRLGLLKRSSSEKDFSCESSA